MALQQTTAQVRAVNPVLTEVARGYRPAGSYIRNALFPTVRVAQRAGRIITFRPEDFQLYNTVRSPGANTPRVQFGRGTADFVLRDHSLEAALPIELIQEARRANPAIDDEARAIAGVQRIMDQVAEKEAADVARTLASYPAANKVTLTGGGQIGDTGVSTRELITTGAEAIRAATGFEPNVVVIPPAVMRVIENDAELLDRLKYTSSNSVTLDMMKQWFRLPGNVVVPTSTYLADTVDPAGVAPTFTDMWGKDIILAYVDVTPLQGMGSPSYGYTYQLDGYPIVEDRYYGNNEKTWYYPVSDCRKPVLTSGYAGYIIQNAVA